MRLFSDLLFETTGDKLFAPLDSKNKRLYVQCLYEINELSNERLNRFLDQSEVMQCVVRVINDYHESVYDEENGDIVQDTPKQQAWYVVNYMIQCGWLRKEQREDNFDFNIFLTENGVKLVRNLRVYLLSTLKEYTGYLQLIYSRLKEMKGTRNSYTLMHRLVWQDARTLIESLQDLNTYVKDMIRTLSRTTTYNELFVNLHEMANGSFLTQWTRLIEQDNRYLRAIEKQLNEILDTDELFFAIVNEYMTEEKVTDQHQAEGYIRSQLNDLVNCVTLSGGFVPRIIAEIRNKIHAYVLTVWNRLQVLEMKGTKNLRELAEKFIQIKKDDDSIPINITYLIKNEQIDLRSIRKKVGPRKRFEQKKEVVERLPASDIVKAKNDVHQRLNDPNSKENIQILLDEMLSGKQFIHVKDFPMETRDQFITAIQALNYAVSLGYKLDAKEGYYETEDFIIRNAEISKEGN